MQRIIDAIWVLVDLVFPCPQPRSRAAIAADLKQRAIREAEDDRLAGGLPGTKDELATCLAAIKELLDREEGRRQGVESRLTTIVGLSSIAGTIVVGAMIAPRSLHGGFGLLLTFALFYLALQLCSAIRSAVSGLARRGYRANMPVDVLPGAEAEAVHLRRQIRSLLATLADHRSVNDEKVTMMAVAHRAMHNFLGGLLALAVIGVVQSVAIKPADDVLQRIRDDQELRESLRGPTGSAGPQGAEGPQGPPGTPCAAAPPNKLSAAPPKR